MGITAYLDTAHWYELAEGRVPTEKFELAVKNGSVIPVLSFIHLMEFASRGEKHRNKVTNYIDHVNALAPIKWIKVLPAIAQAELANAFLRYYGLIPQPIQVFVTSLTDSLSAEIPGLDKAEARTYSVTKIVEKLCGQGKYKAHRSFRKTNPVRDIARLRSIRGKSKASEPPSRSDHVVNALSDMPKVIRTPAGIILEVTRQNRQRFLEHLQRKDCPTKAPPGPSPRIERGSYRWQFAGLRPPPFTLFEWNIEGLLELTPVSSPGQIEGILNRHQRCAGIFRDPLLPSFYGWKEVHVVAEFRHDVLHHFRCELQEGHHRPFRGDVFHLVGGHGQPDYRSRFRIGGFDLHGLSDNFRNEQGVPRAPGIRGAAIELEQVL